jgi:hypothetical protein
MTRMLGLDDGCCHLDSTFSVNKYKKCYNLIGITMCEEVAGT